MTATTLSFLDQPTMVRRPESLSAMTPQEIYETKKLLTDDYRCEVEQFSTFCTDVLDKEINDRIVHDVQHNEFYHIKTPKLMYIFKIIDMYKIEDDKKWWSFNKNSKEDELKYYPIRELFDIQYYIHAYGFKFIENKLIRFCTIMKDNFQLDDQTLFGFSAGRPFIGSATPTQTLGTDFYYNTEKIEAEELTEDEWNGFLKTLNIT